MTDNAARFWADYAEAAKKMGSPVVSAMHPDTAKAIGIPADVVDGVIAGTLSHPNVWLEDGLLFVGRRPA